MEKVIHMLEWDFLFLFYENLVFLLIYLSWQWDLHTQRCFKDIYSALMTFVPFRQVLLLFLKKY